MKIDAIKFAAGGTGPHKIRSTRPAGTGTTGSGRYVHALPFQQAPFNRKIALETTVRNAVIRAGIEGNTGDVRINTDDLAVKVREQANNLFIVFLVDTSESMTTEMRIRAAKGAVLGLLKRAYLQRLSVALVTMGGHTARVLLPPTRSVDLAVKKLYQMPAGGATPFAGGLVTARQLIRTARMQNPAIKSLLFVLSDGEANVPLRPERGVKNELFRLARQIHSERIDTIVIDTSTAHPRQRELPHLSELMGADYHHVRNLRPEGIISRMWPEN